MYYVLWKVILKVMAIHLYTVHKCEYRLGESWQHHKQTSINECKSRRNNCGRLIWKKKCDSYIFKNLQKNSWNHFSQKNSLNQFSQKTLAFWWCLSHKAELMFYETLKWSTERHWRSQCGVIFSLWSKQSFVLHFFVADSLKM